jgi:RNA polymerase sigma factor (sigma-70 family)
MNTVIRQLRRAVLRQDAAGRTDGQLLASFIDQKDEAAFEALVRRHGSMVFGVCRRIVRNHHDAEDAFQATFLVLARKASSVKPRERVANWLHGVALRTARKAKAMTVKRRGREKQVTDMPDPEATQQDQWRDLPPLLDQELNGLPENYRLPILLCELEGKTIKDAALQLGWPQGSLAGRLARGRQLLAKRLASRGVVLSAGSLAAVVSQKVASAAVPTSLMSSTVKAAAMIAAGQATVAGVVPAKVAALMEGVVKSMMLTKLSKAAVAGLVVLCLCGLGVGGFQALLAQETKTSTTTPVPTTATKHGIEELQGTWVRPHETLVIEGNRWSESSLGWTSSGTLKLVAVQEDVLHVDLIMTKGRDQKDCPNTTQCIFRRKGNTLECCHNKWSNTYFHTWPRPTEFKSVGDNLLDVYQLQLVQPEEETAGTGEEAIKREKAAQKIVDAIQGEWEVVQFGPKQDDSKELKSFKWTINGCMITTAGEKKQSFFKVNPAKSPATIDFFDEERRLVSKGRFVLEKDKLTLCMGLTGFSNDGQGKKVWAADRPAKLDPSEGILVILKRPK